MAVGLGGVGLRSTSFGPRPFDDTPFEPAEFADFPVFSTAAAPLFPRLTTPTEIFRSDDADLADRRSVDFLSLTESDAFGEAVFDRGEDFDLAFFVVFFFTVHPNRPKEKRYLTTW
jgi:hypothetical protein